MSIASLGIDFGVLNALNLWVACLIPPKDGQTQLVNIVFHEDRPDLGEIKLVSREMGARVPGAPEHIIVPRANYNRMRSLWLWAGWVEGSNLCAITSQSAPVVRVPLESAPAAVIEPALTVGSGEFDIPFIAAGGKSLGLVRFLPEREGRAASGSILWRATLANPPLAGAAALGPEKAGSLRRVALVRQEKDDVVVEVLDLASGRQLPGASNARIPQAYAIPGSIPGVRVDEQGATHVGLLVATSADLKELAVADISFIPGRDPLPPKLENARKLTLPPVAASVSFQSRPDRPVRRDWVALLPDGSIVHSQSSDKPMRPRGKTVTPLNLVSLSQTTYILTMNPDGPNLEALR